MSDSLFKIFYYSKWLLIICIVIIIFFSWSAVRDYYRQDDLRQDIIKLNQEIEDLAKQQIDLTDTLAYVQSSDFIEIEARTKLNLRKPGEKIIIVSNSNDIERLQLDNQANINKLIDTGESNFKRWLQYFFSSVE